MATSLAARSGMGSKCVLFGCCLVFGVGGPKGEQGTLQSVFCPVRCRQTIVPRRGHHEKQAPLPTSQLTGVSPDLNFFFHFIDVPCPKKSALGQLSPVHARPRKPRKESGHAQGSEPPSPARQAVVELSTGRSGAIAAGALALRNCFLERLDLRSKAVTVARNLGLSCCNLSLSLSLACPSVLTLRTRYSRSL